MKNVYSWYLISNRLHLKKVPILPNLITYIIRFVFGCYIPYSAKIGKGTRFGYGGIGTVIHNRAEIGENCTIDQCVTLGGTSGKYGVPILGDNVYVGAGAKIIGPIRIGNNVVIGANAVVIRDIPSNCVVAGVPARIIKENINIADYK